MKITDVSMVLMTAPHQHAERQRSYGVVVVKCEDGRTGVGEPYAAVNLPMACCEAIRALSPLFVGHAAEDFLDVMARAHATVEYFDHRGMIQCLLGAMDWALHDLAAQRAGVPLHRLLNPQSRSSVELYASTGLAKWSVAMLLDELKARADEGYQTIKMRIGGGVETSDQAIARAEAAATCLHGRVSLCIDGGQQIFVHNRWTLSEAKRIAAELATLGIAFFEDPYLISDMSAYQALRRGQSVAIAGGEMFNEPRDFDRYLDAGALDIIQPDACVVPGPQAVLEVMASARRRGIRSILHGWAGPVAQMQNVHAALAGDCDLVEFSTLYHPLLFDGLAPIWRFCGGRLAAPEIPGMGTVPIDSLVAKYPFKSVSTLIA